MLSIGREWEFRGGLPRSKCLDRDAGSQDSTCSSYGVQRKLLLLWLLFSRPLLFSIITKGNLPIGTRCSLYCVRTAKNHDIRWYSLVTGFNASEMHWTHLAYALPPSRKANIPLEIKHAEITRKARKTGWIVLNTEQGSHDTTSQLTDDEFH